MELDYNAESKMFSLMDNEEELCIVLTQEQLEALIDHYCKVFGSLFIP